MTPSFRTNALIALALVAIVGLFVAAFVNWLNLPHVYLSAETGKCVRVEDSAASKQDRKPWTCAELPKQYEAIWVP